MQSLFGEEKGIMFLGKSIIHINNRKKNKKYNLSYVFCLFEQAVMVLSPLHLGLKHALRV
jgi:hypothetical protein